MKAVKDRFIRILRAELDDVEEDIVQLLSECRRNFDKGTLTEHVFCENLGLLKNEMLGVGDFAQILDNIKPSEYETLDAMIEAITSQFRTEIRHCGLAPAIEAMIARKIQKVRTFLSDETP